MWKLLGGGRVSSCRDKMWESAKRRSLRPKVRLHQFPEPLDLVRRDPERAFPRKLRQGPASRRSELLGPLLHTLERSFGRRFEGRIVVVSLPKSMFLVGKAGGEGVGRELLVKVCSRAGREEGV